MYQGLDLLFPKMVSDRVNTLNYTLICAISQIDGGEEWFSVISTLTAFAFGFQLREEALGIGVPSYRRYKGYVSWLSNGDFFDFCGCFLVIA